MPTAEYGRPEWDLYPESADEYNKLVSWCITAFDNAERFRRPHEEKWRRYYRLYNNWVETDPNDWHSRVFMPEVFQNIETIKPRLIAELPKFVVLPQRQDDIQTSKTMEELLQHAVRESKLYVELYKAYHDMLLYGTGVIKTFYGTRQSFLTRQEPVIHRETVVMPEPLIDPETGEPLRDADGNVVMDNKEVPIEVPTGETRPVLETYDSYDGPMAEAVDLFNFWVEPQATDIDSAHYVIHRTFQKRKYVKKMIDEGKYRLPEHSDEFLLSSSAQQPHMERLDSIDLGGGKDHLSDDVEIWEIHINDGPGRPGRIVTMADKTTLLRAEANVYYHSQKPFCVFYDYMQPHEFWGRGEVQAIEGLQDLVNFLTNRRVDNVVLGMDQGYVVNESQLKDLRDLVSKPGRVVRIKGDAMAPKDVVEPLPTTEVTSSAFAEVQQAQNMIERTTGVSAYQMGTDSESLTETATGMAMIQEAGSSRFALKTRINELEGLQRLALHFGSIIQQFTTEDKVVRLTGPEGLVSWLPVTPQDLQGALDYSISSESIMQSETMRRQQKMDVFNLTVQAVTMGVLPPQAALVAYMDVLETFGVKDKEKYLTGQAMLPSSPSPEQGGLGDLSQPAADLGAQGAAGA